MGRMKASHPQTKPWARDPFDVSRVGEPASGRRITRKSTIRK
ncbi:hypothetical protein M7I_3311 [Glarea lozoyensis 74030]|uniref:Uncharacterized protein n=1 Tax=Glarea lozoyensis (strain ATCC 74030 / MF5533) TaxID=1104152 RepID=H0EL53_GLAL7|nr:hypothetical protein M7I_3311 [Glarea lozoyensis 74030]